MTSILVDANILCLIVAGRVLPEQIGKHKRLRAYSNADLDVITDFLEPYKKIVLCPHVLTETSNLLAHTNEAHKSVLLEGLREVADACSHGECRFSKAMERPEYLRLGFTDAVLLALKELGSDLLTADLDLYLAASIKGTLAVNVNHIIR